MRSFVVGMVSTSFVTFSLAGLSLRRNQTPLVSAFKEKAGAGGGSGRKVLVLCVAKKSLEEKQWEKICEGEGINGCDVYGVGMEIDDDKNLKLKIGSEGWKNKMENKFGNLQFWAIIDEFCDLDVVQYFPYIYDNYLENYGYWYMAEMSKFENAIAYRKNFWGIFENRCLVNFLQIYPRCEFLLGKLCDKPNPWSFELTKTVVYENLNLDSIKCEYELITVHKGLGCCQGCLPNLCEYDLKLIRVEKSNVPS